MNLGRNERARSHTICVILLFPVQLNNVQHQSRIRSRTQLRMLSHFFVFRSSCGVALNKDRRTSLH